MMYIVSVEVVIYVFWAVHMRVASYDSLSSVHQVLTLVYVLQLPQHSVIHHLAALT
jgi:hypothetical protein